MLPQIERLELWLSEGKRAAMATVVAAYGSSPCPVGSRMIVSSSREHLGTIGGPSIDEKILERALQIIETGKAELIQVRFTDAQAQSLGSGCGGEIEIFVERVENE